MHLEILTPDKKLFTGEVSSVTVPGSSGSFTVLNDHAPIVSTLEKGDVLVNSGASTFPIKSGVIEVLKNQVIILAEE